MRTKREANRLNRSGRASGPLLQGCRRRQVESIGHLGRIGGAHQWAEEAAVLHPRWAFVLFVALGGGVVVLVGVPGPMGVMSTSVRSHSMTIARADPRSLHEDGEGKEEEDQESPPPTPTMEWPKQRLRSWVERKENHCS